MIDPPSDGPDQPPIAPWSIFLIGLSGSGKSTVGRILAERLGLPFVDTDAEIESASGRTVADIFDIEGEPTFRALEHETVTRVCREGPAVVATGGGAPMDPRSQRAMREGGIVFWLDAPTAVLTQRLSAQSVHRRPLLEEGMEESLERLRAARVSVYASLGSRVEAIASPEAVAEQILSALDDRLAARRPKVGP